MPQRPHPHRWQSLLRRREFQDRSEHSRKRSVIGKSQIVKYQVLQGSLLDRLQYKPMCAVDQRDDLYRPAQKGDRLLRAVSRAYAAAQADGFIDNGLFVLHGDRENRTYHGAFPTGDAALRT